MRVTRRRRRLGALLACCAALAAPDTVAADKASQSPAGLEVFVGESCPHCATAKLFLHKLQRERPPIRIIAQDQAARARLEELAALTGVHVSGAPVFSVRGQVLVGFAGEAMTGRQLRMLLDQPAPPRPRSSGPDGIDTRGVGRLSPRDLGLPLFTLAIGLLDGFNPCAMWVLLFLLSLLVNLRSRLTMALIAGTFVVVSGLVYFAFMAAWLNVLLFIGPSQPVPVALGMVAGTIGAINVKDFFAFGQGPSLVIPGSAKPGFRAWSGRI